MAPATETISPNGKVAPGQVHQHQRPVPTSAVRRRRQVPWVVGGVLLVVGCGLAFGVASVRLSAGEQVLAVAKAVPMGQVVEPADLQVVTLPAAAGLDPVLAAAEGSAIGRPAAVPLEPGTLLTPADLGSPSGAAAGQDVVALALPAGAYPPSLGPGDTVEVVQVASASGASTTAPLPAKQHVRAVVLGIDAAPTASNASTVISLQVAPSQAATVATLGAAGRAALVELPEGTRS